MHVQVQFGKQFLGETADGSLNQLWSKWAKDILWITVENPELIHAISGLEPTASLGALSNSGCFY